MKNFYLGSITDIPIRLDITFVVFLPLLAWLISRPAQLAFDAGFVERISLREIDVAASRR